jgi:hydrogenase expression/formation protein HypE
MQHGNGGQETRDLIQNLFMKYFRNECGSSTEDAIILSTGGKIAFTTDTFVVRPLFFPGGDIGRLAVCGTVNDLLTSGAVPKYISAAFVLEEGLEMNELEAVVASMQRTAEEAGVSIVTGDTKVVDGDGGLFINTAGIGDAVVRSTIRFQDAVPGDRLIVTGTLGDHHACIMSKRMGITNQISSDAAPLGTLLDTLYAHQISIHGVRDITRGGLATCLHETLSVNQLGAVIQESEIPVNPDVAGLCQILGLDPLYMANEGKMLLAIPPQYADEAITFLQQCPYGQQAAIVGEIRNEPSLTLQTRLGAMRRLLPLIGESLPRIC